LGTVSPVIPIKTVRPKALSDWVPIPKFIVPRTDTAPVAPTESKVIITPFFRRAELRDRVYGLIGGRHSHFPARAARARIVRVSRSERDCGAGAVAIKDESAYAQDSVGRHKVSCLNFPKGCQRAWFVAGRIFAECAAAPPTGVVTPTSTGRRNHRVRRGWVRDRHQIPTHGHRARALCIWSTGLVSGSVQYPH
jgi:hypothetical protein